MSTLRKDVGTLLCRHSVTSVRPRPLRATLYKLHALNWFTTVAAIATSAYHAFLHCCANCTLSIELMVTQ
jgi:hypothetical protein